MPYVVYILICSDGSYYTGSAADLGLRLWEHEEGISQTAYTYNRRPVKLMWNSEEFDTYAEALHFERQVKGWSRVKKEALMRDDYDAIHEIVKTERIIREAKKKIK